MSYFSFLKPLKDRKNELKPFLDISYKIQKKKYVNKFLTYLEDIISPELDAISLIKTFSTQPFYPSS